MGLTKKNTHSYIYYYLMIQQSREAAGDNWRPEVSMLHVLLYELISVSAIIAHSRHHIRSSIKTLGLRPRQNPQIPPPPNLAASRSTGSIHHFLAAPTLYTATSTSSPNST
ncbi:hypothetical protein M758_UG229400 [Ceratodon purpureus]|nr:hypothetical protein M758_UG229400 [Ceratodon purpureus]